MSERRAAQHPNHRWHMVDDGKCRPARDGQSSQGSARHPPSHRKCRSPFLVAACEVATAQYLTAIAKTRHFGTVTSSFEYSNRFYPPPNLSLSRMRVGRSPNITEVIGRLLDILIFKVVNNIIDLLCFLEHPYNIFSDRKSQMSLFSGPSKRIPYKVFKFVSKKPDDGPHRISKGRRL